MRRMRIPMTVWLLLAVCVAIIVPFVLFEEPIEAFFNSFGDMNGRALWVSAAILFAALALDIFLPIPSSLVSTLMGMLLGVGGGWALSFMAMNVSALIGYWVGVRCAARARRLIGEREAEALERFFGMYGSPVLVALRTVPVLAGASVVFAGLARLPWRRSACWIGVGNAVVSILYAVVGAWGKTADAMLPAFGASLLLSGGLLVAARLTLRAAKRRKA